MGFINKLYESDELNAAGDVGEFIVACADDLNWLIDEKVKCGSFFEPATTNYLAGDYYVLAHLLSSFAPELWSDMGFWDGFYEMVESAARSITPSIDWHFRTHDELLNEGWLADCGYGGMTANLPSGEILILTYSDEVWVVGVYDSDYGHIESIFGDSAPDAMRKGGLYLEEH